jgi:GNAT superfamily N-acetyltransferase
MTQLEIRPATLADVPRLERKCWGGGEAEMRQRVREQGTCSIIALDGELPVAQLYLRAYRPGFRSGGLYDGAWWADLKGVEEVAELPRRTVLLGCWHVGRVREADGTDREAPEYRGRGLGKALLQAAIDWLRSAAPFEALAAKATDCEDRRYINFVGGLPLSIFESLGFERIATFEDPYFPPAPERHPDLALAEHPERFHLVLLRREGG